MKNVTGRWATGLACCLAAFGLGTAMAAAQTKPNIIFILADDVGLSDISCYGGDHTPTPNIDLLAKDGLRFIVDFITRHRDKPFLLYYPMVHVHNPIGPTPDSRPNSTAKIGSAEFYADNIRYMDKLVGQLVTELDRLKLRDKTLILFAGDNGSDSQAKDTPSTLHGRKRLQAVLDELKPAGAAG